MHYILKHLIIYMRMIFHTDYVCFILLTFLNDLIDIEKGLWI